VLGCLGRGCPDIGAFALISSFLVVRGVDRYSRGMESSDDHVARRMALEAEVVGPARTDVTLRSGVMARAAGGPVIAAPFDDLARQIGEAAHRVTDGQVANVRAALGTDKSAFEVVLAASVGAGLSRWDAASRAMKDADDAAR
jgi:hypothetical protein